MPPQQEYDARMGARLGCWLLSSLLAGLEAPGKASKAPTCFLHDRGTAHMESYFLNALETEQDMEVYGVGPALQQLQWPFLASRDKSEALTSYLGLGSHPFWGTPTSLPDLHLRQNMLLRHGLPTWLRLALNSPSYSSASVFFPHPICPLLGFLG